MRFHTPTAFMATLIAGTTLAIGVAAQQHDSTYRYSETITQIQPETGVVNNATTTTTTKTTTRLGPAPTLKDEMPSPNYNHSYYTYSETFKGPALVYGGIEEPVIIDNGAPELTPIRTLAQ